MKIDNTYSIISKIYGSMNDLLISELRENNIDNIVPSHGSIIMVLLKHKELSMNEIANKIGKTPQTVTTLVKKLISLGYVEKKKSESDQRASIVKLTEKGLAFESILILISEKIFEKQYLGMNEEEIKILRKLLMKMESNFLD